MSLKKLPQNAYKTHTHTRIIHYSSTAIIQKKIPSSWSNLSEEENEEILCTKK